MQSPPNPYEFLDAVRPALAMGDAATLAKTFLERWRPTQLCPLVSHQDADIRRVAAVVLGIVGDMSVAGCLTKALRDDDEQVNQMAEHGLWSIWFRAGNPQAARPFCQGIAALAAESYCQAVDHFRMASMADPNFAEAYNQQAIAHHFLRQWPQSLANGAKAVRLVPSHFGAIAGMGHCYTQMGELDKALQCYRRALGINPRMPAIALAIVELQQRMRRLNDASGMFNFGHVGV